MSLENEKHNDYQKITNHYQYQNQVSIHQSLYFVSSGISNVSSIKNYCNIDEPLQQIFIASNLVK